MKKKIFVTGVAGFLGSHLADAFVAGGHHVVGCDNLVGGYLDNVHKDVDFFKYDCNAYSRMRKIIAGCDIVYHCAATPYEGLSVFSPHLITKNVFGSSASVMSAAVAEGVGRFVFLSSMARYGANLVPFTEDMEPKPQDPYAIAKVAAELLLRELSETHGMEYSIAVPHNIIGTRQKYDDPYRNVASIMINLMLQGRQPIIYGDGGQERCFSFVQDCVRCLEGMAFEKSVLGEVVNIGPDEESITIRGLADMIGDLLQFGVEPIFVPGRPREVRFAMCSADKARRLLGYRTEYTLRRGLQEMIEYIRVRGVRKFKYHLDIEIVNDRLPRTWRDKVF